MRQLVAPVRRLGLLGDEQRPVTERCADRVQLRPVPSSHGLPTGGQVRQQDAPRHTVDHHVMSDQ
jgi:hypothetical protein